MKIESKNNTGCTYRSWWWWAKRSVLLIKNSLFQNNSFDFHIRQFVSWWFVGTSFWSSSSLWCIGWYLTDFLLYLFVLTKATSCRFWVADLVWWQLCLSLEWRAGRKVANKWIILFNLIHKKTVLNFEDVIKFQNFMIFVGMFCRRVKFFKINFFESTILDFLHYFFDFLIFLAP